MRADRLLILGGAGMVGLQVAREAARELRPSAIIVSALTSAEVDEAISVLSEEAKQSGWSIDFIAAPADIFIADELQGVSRAELLRDRRSFDLLFEDIFAPTPDAFARSALNRMVAEHRPDVIVDCINTATAISYQDVFTISRKVKMLIDRAEDEGSVAGDRLSEMVDAVRELLVAQGVPQMVRHILFLHRILEQSAVRVYLKVGTTGTGGMGVNIPYTHSEDRPSATLLSKSAIGFAHTGLLFLLARTPAGVTAGDGEKAAHGVIVKEIKPGAMIGFKRLGLTHVKLAGAGGKREPAFLLAPRRERLGEMIDSRQEASEYERFERRDVPLQMIGADTGENGFFSLGEFQAITYPRQMEYVTPEEVARVVVLEILGSSTGRDVISAIDGAITEPSYRAGVLRAKACSEMERLERLMEGSDALPSIAVGHLGPPRLSKLLIEAWLIRAAVRTSKLDELGSLDPHEMRRRTEEYLEANDRIVSQIVTIGIPILRESATEGLTLTRGPRLNIPVPGPDGSEVPLTPEAREKYAWSGWIDLREKNFEIWRDRLQRAALMQPDIARHGSAAFDRSKYLPAEFTPGDFVGWLLTNEVDDLGMVGRRLF